jgi:hypothetical protein
MQDDTSLPNLVTIGPLKKNYKNFNDYCFWSLGTSKRKSNMVPGLSLTMRPTVIAVFPMENSLKKNKKIKKKQQYNQIGGGIGK